MRPAYLPAWRSRSAWVMAKPLCTLLMVVSTLLRMARMLASRLTTYRVVFLRGAEQALAFQQHLIVAVDQFGQSGICQAYIDRKYFVGMIRIVGIAGQELYQPELGAVFSTFFFVFRVFTQCQLGVAFQVGQPGIALEGFQFLFRGSQFTVDDINTFINKFCGLGSLLRFYRRWHPGCRFPPVC